MVQVLKKVFLLLSFGILKSHAADKFYTVKSYSDSSCKYLTQVVTYDASIAFGSASVSDCSSLAENSCTANSKGDDDGDGTRAYKKTSCGSSLTGEMPGAYFVTYTDTACATALYATGILGYGECASTSYSTSKKAECDDEYITTYDCTGMFCNSCTELSMMRTGTCLQGTNEDGTYSYKVTCGDSKDDVCFFGGDKLLLESGAVKLLSEVALGDKVQTADANGVLSFSEVLALPHAANNKLASFVNVATTSGKSVKATKMHLLQQCNGSLAYAASLVVGDCLRTVDGDEAVTAVSMAMAEGIYTAVTTNEFIVVNGIVASPFAVSHSLANAYYNAHRIVAQVFPSALKSPLVFAANAFLTGLTGAFFTAAGSK